MYTKKCAKFCEVCAHFSLASWYYINRKNPPIHYIVFATPHKKKYLLQKKAADRRLPFFRYLARREKQRIVGQMFSCDCGL